VHRRLPLCRLKSRKRRLATPVGRPRCQLDVVSPLVRTRKPDASTLCRANHKRICRAFAPLPEKHSYVDQTQLLLAFASSLSMYRSHCRHFNSRSFNRPECGALQACLGLLKCGCTICIAPLYQIALAYQAEVRAE
jgi:hypothetical protein